MVIENEAYDFPWTFGIMSDCLKVAYHCFVYEVEGEVRGYIIYSTVLDEVHLLNICINPHYQNKGYGQALLTWLMNRVKEKGSRTLYLEVRASNYAAIHLYETMGFNELGIRANYYPAKKGKEDAQLFAYELIHY
jgi:ribosomal-protein-alanine N-acetyltransferase